MVMTLKYTEDMPEKLLKYYRDRERFEIEIVKRFNKDGDVIEEKEVRRPVAPATIEGFASSLTLSKTTLYEWAKIYPEFKKAMAVCKQLQAEHIIANSMEGLNNNAFPIFMMKNCHGWTDKVESKVENKVTLENIIGDSFKDEPIKDEDSTNDSEENI